MPGPVTKNMFTTTTKYFLVITLLLAITISSCEGFFLNNNISPTAPKTVPENVKLLILPGFGNDSVDYTMPSSLFDSLKERGWSDDQIRVLPVDRKDWLQVFLRGALDYKFWLATAEPTRPAFRWYLDRIAAEIDALQDGEKMVLVGHSAGGWLGRAAIGFGSEEEGATQVDLNKVAGLVSLGAPHLPPPEGVMDMTRGALRITNERFPGSYHAPSMFYVTVIGLSIVGKKQERSSPLEPTSVDGFAFNSYEAVCGDGTAIGDGVVPQCASHLDDAIQLDLDGVYHSINRLDKWYGASDILDSWHQPMLKELNSRTSSRQPSSQPFAAFFNTQS